MARTVDHQQHRERREAITLAAAALFARRGFAGTTTAEIARAAGISTGSLFYYFPDKPAIFRAIFELDIPASRELFQAHVDSDDPAASILEVVSTLAAPARDEPAPGLMVELLRQAGSDPQLREVVATNEAIVQDGLATLLRRAAADGLVDRSLDAGQGAVWIRTIIDAAFLNAGRATDVDPLPMLRLIITRFLGMNGATQDPNAEQETSWHRPSRTA
ncbi:MAG: TetR/AcrR family transcriptional regulator [Pseudonocardiaceae bacterium]